MKKLYLIGCTALLLGACNKTPQDYQLTGTFEGDSLEYVLVMIQKKKTTAAM